MEEQKQTAQQPDQPALYELWRPIIRPRRRTTLERMHQNIAEDWSTSLRDFLARGEQFEFMGLAFESFQQLSDKDGGECQTAGFAIEKTEIVGFLLLGDVQARILVDNRLGMGRTEPVENEARKFSRIEGAILRDAINLMMVRLGAAYTAAGLGHLVVTRQSERLKDTLVFSPQDYLVILRFRVGAAPNPVAVTIAVSSNVINAVRDMAGTDRAGGDSPRLQRGASELPVRMDVVLGSWSVAPGELAALGVGDELVLPDGGDAWLEARGVRLRKVRARFDGPETTVEIVHEQHPSSIVPQLDDARIVIQAVLARLSVPAGAIAALSVGDEIEVEPEVGFGPMVRLVSGGRTVATASLSDDGDRLVAKITKLGPEPTGRKDDRWLFRKKAPLNFQ